MAVIVINPSDMTSKPDFNILNDNVVNTVNYEYNETELIEEEKGNVVVSVFDNDNNLIINNKDDNPDITVIYQNIPDYSGTDGGLATNNKYCIFKCNVDIGEVLARVDFSTTALDIKYVCVSTKFSGRGQNFNGYYETVFADQIPNDFFVDFYEHDTTEESIINNWVYTNRAGNVAVRPEWQKSEQVVIGNYYPMARCSCVVKKDNTLDIYFLISVSGNTIYTIPTEDSYEGVSYMDIHSIVVTTKDFFVETKYISNESNADISLSSNELNQINTKIKDTQIFTYIANDIKAAYKNGKQTLTMTTYYCEYKDTDGNVVYSGKDGKTLKVGDIVEPRIRKQDQIVPISRDPSGNAKIYEIVSSSILYNGKIKNTISCVEKITSFHTITFPSSDVVTISLTDDSGNNIPSGSKLERYTNVTVNVTSNNRLGKIYINDIEIENGSTFEIISDTVIGVEYYAYTTTVKVPATFTSYSEAQSFATLSDSAVTYGHIYNEEGKDLLTIDGTNLFKYELGNAISGTSGYFEKICSGYIKELGTVTMDFSVDTPDDWLQGYEKGDLTISVNDRSFTASTNTYSGAIVRLYSVQGTLTRI